MSKLFTNQNLTKAEIIEELSKILGRDISKESVKAPDDYNFGVLSHHVDRGFHFFTQIGMKSIKPLDLIKVNNAFEDFKNGNNNKTHNFQKSIADQNYEIYRFDHSIESELRVNFFLQTSKNDTFGSLMSELEKDILYYMSEVDWKKLKSAIVKGNERINKEKIRFPDSVVSQGQKIFVTKNEQESWGLIFNPEFNLYEQNDGPDLLALRELVEIVKGKEVHPLSIGFGFLLKYMPEITKKEIQNNLRWPQHLKHIQNENYIKHDGVKRTDIINNNGFIEGLGTDFTQQDFDHNSIPDAIIFKVNKKTKALINVSFGYIPQQQNMFHTGFFKSFLSMTYNIICPENKTLKGVEIFENERYATTCNLKNLYKKEELGFKNLDETFKDLDNYSYYVVVDSQISGNNRKTNYEYNQMVYADKIIDAGECYLFEKEGEDFIFTRLYFYPYNPSMIHPLLQHGSVIFGSNDFEHHPCNINLNIDDEDLYNDEIDKIKELTFHYSDKFLYHPIMTTAMYKLYQEKGNKEKDPMSLFKPEFREYFKLIPENLVAFNADVLTAHDIVLTKNPFSCPLISYYSVFEFLRKRVIQNLLPFNQRFAIWKYKDDFKGINKDEMKTFLWKLANDMESNNTSNLIMMSAQLDQVKKLVSQGMTYEEARKKVYTPDQLERINEILKMIS